MKFAGAVWAALRCSRSTARPIVDGEFNMATQLKQAPHGTPAWFHQTASLAQNDVITEVVMLTPQLATEILKYNDHNRHIRQTKVAQYSADMSSGRWMFNGEPIIISKDGKVNDGQHRAHAVIDANTPIKTLMIFGLDRDTRTTVDQGSARGAGDYAAMEGIQNAMTASTIARLVMAYERSSGQSLHAAKEVTNAEIMQRLHDDQKIAEAATYGTSVGRHANKFAAGTVIGFCFCILSRIDYAEAKTYMDQVCMGEGLRRADPAHTVREKLLDEKKDRARKAAIILRGWNFYRRGRKVQSNGLKATLPFPALV
jgi:hypothetical protein